MKLTEFEGKSMDLPQEELECMKQQDDEFWGSIRELIRYGVPSYDKNGHWAEIRVRVRPLQLDMISAIKEKMPEGWFKNSASLYRSIVAVGCKTILRTINMERTEWDEILESLNHIAKKTRKEKFKEEVSSLRSDIAGSAMPTHEKVKIVDLVTKLEKRIMGL